MTKFKNILWGIVLVAIGVLLALNSLGVTDVNLLFDGWWTLFIIVPCFIDLFEKGNKTGDIIGLAIGVALLLACRDILDFDLVWKLALPAILIIVGISILFKSTIDKKLNEKICELKKKATNDTNSKNSYCALFSGQDVKFSNEVLEGASFTAIFGGIECDLRGAIIEKDILIDSTAVFGGIDIIVPSNVKVKVKSSSIFGGVSDKSTFSGDEAAPTVYINAAGIFGGVDIK